jgi:hypothetical protein
LANSPYNVKYKNKLDPKNTTAEGYGLRDGVSPNKQTFFTITAKDKNNKIKKDEEEFKIIIDGPDRVYPKISSNNDGYFNY